MNPFGTSADWTTVPKGRPSAFRGSRCAVTDKGGDEARGLPTDEVAEEQAASPTVSVASQAHPVGGWTEGRLIACIGSPVCRDPAGNAGDGAGRPGRIRPGSLQSGIRGCGQAGSTHRLSALVSGSSLGLGEPDLDGDGLVGGLGAG